MSRFYETLKRASRSLPDPQESAVTKDKDPDVSPTLNHPHASKVSEKANAANFFADIPPGIVSEQLLQNETSRQNGSFGISTQAVLGKTARLIPNSVDPIVLEFYCSLRTSIMQQRAEKIFRSLLVASADPKEGKTITTLNLALTFSMLPSFKVLVVDGDLRSGQLGRSLGIDARPGLSNLLEGSAKIDEVILKSSEIPFCFMSRGTSTLSPPELLQPVQWANWVRRLSEHFDLVLVDSPPARLLTDAQLMASGCEAVLLVARAFHSSREALENASQTFRRFRVIGAVLNESPTIRSEYRYRSYFRGVE